MIKSVFKLADEAVSHETVEALESLLNKAKNGDVIGIAFVAMNKQRTYNTNTAGELHRNMTFAVGTLMVLVARLLREILNRKPGK